jgi:hypothetical protein
MIAEVYEAFLAAGVSKETAKSAAEALASEQLATKHDIILMEQNLKVLDAKITMLQWMVGGVGFGVFLLIFKTFLKG